MIFENDKVTQLVNRWQRTHSKDVLDRIVELSTPLIEAIVSSYPSDLREDLIQESTMKLINACKYFNSGNGSLLHNYFTTVVHNACISFISKPKELLIDDNNLEAQEEDEYESNEIEDGSKPEVPEDLQDLLPELILYLRKRFPSLPASVLDESAEIAFSALKNEEPSKIIIDTIQQATCCAKSISTVIYQSIMIYLRYRTISNAKTPDYENEFTLIQDMRLILGEEVYRKIMIIFAGMYLKLPK